MYPKCYHLKIIFEKITNEIFTLFFFYILLTWCVFYTHSTSQCGH